MSHVLVLFYSAYLGICYPWHTYPISYQYITSSHLVSKSYQAIIENRIPNFIHIGQSIHLSPKIKWINPLPDISSTKDFERNTILADGRTVRTRTTDRRWWGWWVNTSTSGSCSVPFEVLCWLATGCLSCGRVTFEDCSAETTDCCACLWVREFGSETDCVLFSSEQWLLTKDLSTYCLMALAGSSH